MKLREISSLLIIVVGVLCVVGYFSNKAINTPHHTGIEEYEGHDNFVEEFTESVVERIFGLSPNSIDFTPKSKEEVASAGTGLSDYAIDVVVEYLKQRDLYKEADAS